MRWSLLFWLLESNPNGEDEHETTTHDHSTKLGLRRFDSRAHPGAQDIPNRRITTPNHFLSQIARRKMATTHRNDNPSSSGWRIHVNTLTLRHFVAAVEINKRFERSKKNSLPQISLSRPYDHMKRPLMNAVITIRAGSSRT